MVSFNNLSVRIISKLFCVRPSDDNWDDKDAIVVCRMLGLNSTFARAVKKSAFGAVPDTFVMDEVRRSLITSCSQ